MSSGLLGFAIALAVALVLAFPLGNALRSHPAPFYCAALALTGLYLWGLYGGANLVPLRALALVFQKAYLSVALLAIVMFTGCLSKTSALRKRLQPVRAQLSILSFIFVVGHLGAYLPAFLPRLGMVFSLKGNLAASLIVALVLTLVFALLTVTSLRAVHRAMSPGAWKAVQRLSYVMVALLMLHVALALGRSAFGAGAVVAVTVIALYAAGSLVYAGLRIRKAVADGKGRVPEAVSEAAPEVVA